MEYPTAMINLYVFGALRRYDKSRIGFIINAAPNTPYRKTNNQQTTTNIL
jgi:hypothetical protein